MFSICLQCNSESSFFRFGGIVVIRHFTVASAELISNPESFVSILNTEIRGITSDLNLIVNNFLYINTQELFSLNRRLTF